MLASLTYLKSQLLAEALRATTEYDQAITALGAGVAAQMDRFCNRKFARAASATFDISADRNQFFVDRYPVESVASIALQTDPTTGFETVSGGILNWEAKTGLIYLGGRLGEEWQTLRVTFTGGYYLDTSDTGDGDTVPAGATALPRDVRLAWVLQCKKIWQVNDPLGVRLAGGSDNARLTAESLGGLELLPEVETILRGHIRFQIT